MPTLVPALIKPVAGRQLARLGLGEAAAMPALMLASEHSAKRFLDFFTVNIRNRHTRRAYFDAVAKFSAWCEGKGLHDLTAIEPVHVAAFVEDLGRVHAKPTVKQHLAALRMLFDWLVTGQIVASNPAHAVRGPRHSVRKGKTAVMSPQEMHDLLASINTGTLIGLRDRALIGQNSSRQRGRNTLTARFREFPHQLCELRVRLLSFHDVVEDSIDQVAVRQELTHGSIVVLPTILSTQTDNCEVIMDLSVIEFCTYKPSSFAKPVDNIAIGESKTSEQDALREHQILQMMEK